ncbi:MAG: hypothetical protein GF330_00850 [Candidatus Eisenbacteria bacterium]|nr:hypothetical protein [Candidatus Eisenbacteria bacterium]
MILERSARNPILTRASIPDCPPEIIDASAVFNPGAIKLGEEYWLLLRVQTRGRQTHLMRACSRDGERFEVLPELIRPRGLERVRGRLHHLYDPRLSWLEGQIYAVVALDVDAGCRVGLLRGADLASFELLAVISDADARNAVLFPQRVGGRYLRLDRPHRGAASVGVGSGDEIWLSESDDLLHWRPVQRVLEGRWHYWDERIGPGPPPIRTREGWLCIYHGVAHHLSAAHIYQAGVFLLDLEDPAQLLARGRDNILEPREPYEMVGQVPNVVFPSGVIVEKSDGGGFARPESLVRIYYGAADSSVALATTTIAALLDAARR